MRFRVSFAVNEKKFSIIIPFRALLRLIVSSLCLLPDCVLTWLAVVLAAAALNQLYEPRLSHQPLSSKPQARLRVTTLRILEVTPHNVWQVGASAWRVETHFCTFCTCTCIFNHFSPSVGWWWMEGTVIDGLHAQDCSGINSRPAVFLQAVNESMVFWPLPLWHPVGAIKMTDTSEKPLFRPDCETTGQPWRLGETPRFISKQT